ncbi:hypothetical protein [Labedaea rhizosphaerae]|uniref:hypothetical protein n=1 Tax=Labedaea rhizosphaerae TaxID=598644 RepID=UPI0010610928|nr:hypothetical protein [Labedaea rhizosphaerae]
MSGGQERGVTPDQDVEEPLLLFETELSVRQAWWGIWFFVAFGALCWIAAGIKVSPVWFAGLLPAAFAAWANVNLRNVVTVTQELKWILLAVAGLVVDYGALFVFLKTQR